MAELIRREDSLNTGRKKLNEAIKASERAESKSDYAVDTAETALSNSESTQIQLSQAILEGDSSPLGGQLSVGADDTVYTGPQERLISEYRILNKQITEESDKNFYSSISSNRSVKPAITFIDDDARREVWTILKPFVEQKKIPFTSAVITRRVETNNQYTLTAEEINELSRSGLWEFVSHTATHQDLRNISLSEVEQELKESRDWLLRQGFNADVIVYPYGGYNDDVIDLVGRYYRLGMNFNVITPRINNVPVESYKIQRIDFDFDIEDIKQCIDDAIASDGWVIVTTHCHYEHFDTNKLEEIIDYAQTAGIDIVNTREGINRFGNYLELGSRPSRLMTEGTVIDAKGEVYGSKIGVVKSINIIREFITSESKIHDFDQGKITVAYVTSASQSGFPENMPGELETRRYHNDDFSYQTYKIFNSHRKYLRNWNTSTDSWDNWVSLEPEERVIWDNSINGNTPPNYYKNGITIGRVAEPDSSLPGIGTIKTIKHISTLYSWQTFKAYGNHDTYVRYPTGNETWSSWRKFVTESI